MVEPSPSAIGRTLAPVLVDTVRELSRTRHRLHLARLLMRLGRERRRTLLVMLSVAIDMLTTQDTEIGRVREQVHHLREENRRLREEMQRYVAAVVHAESA